MSAVMELQQKSAELRHAALRFQASAQTLRSIVVNVTHIADDLTLLGYESPAATQWMAHYRSEHSWMTGWADTLLHFAQRLNEAADQIDSSIAEMEHPAPAAHAEPLVALNDSHVALASASPHGVTAHALALHAPHPAPNPLETLEDVYLKIKSVALSKIHNAMLPGAGEYFSTFNRSRLEQYMIEQQSLAAKQVGLSNLLAQRGSTEQSLHMLLEHAATDQNPQLLKIAQDAEEKLRLLNLQIKGASWDVDHLRTEVTTLHERLELLRPAPDANVELIRSMEASTSPDWLKKSTFDCVRYIVSRVSVPPAIARDAYLWNDQTAILHEYGIKVGQIPMPGSVLVMEQAHPYADPIHGHLMYVERVENGEVWITDNLHPKPVKLSDLTDQTSGPNMEYLYFPWQTHA
jgi:hypothetical protein